MQLHILVISDKECWTAPQNYRAFWQGLSSKNRLLVTQSAGKPKKDLQGILARAEQLDIQVAGNIECWIAPKKLQGVMAKAE